MSPNFASRLEAFQVGERLSDSEVSMETFEVHQTFGAFHPWNCSGHLKSRSRPSGESLADVLQPNSVMAELATNQSREVGERLAMPGEAQLRSHGSDALQGL